MENVIDIEMPKAWVGIDPGLTGAYALIDEYNTLHTAGWKDTLAAHRDLVFWSELWDIKLICIEDVRILPRDSKRSGATFMKHVGEWHAILKMCAFNWATVTPQKWMKRRVTAKQSALDKPSVRYVQKKYPLVDLRGPRGGLRDGIADAICIAEYAKEVSE